MANLCFFYAYKEGRKGKDDAFSCETDDEVMCILVWFIWYSYALISSVTYILCIFFFIIEIIPQRKMMTPQRVCESPIPK